MRAEQPGQVLPPVVGYLPEQYLLERPAGPGQGGQDPQPPQPRSEQPVGVEQQPAQALSVLSGPAPFPAAQAELGERILAEQLAQPGQALLAQRLAGLGVVPPRLHLAAPVRGQPAQHPGLVPGHGRGVGVRAGPGERRLAEHHLADGELLGHPRAVPDQDRVGAHHSALHRGARELQAH